MSRTKANALRVAGETIAMLLKRLRELRRRHALTQEAFAERAGMSYKYYQAVEAGRKRNLGLSTLETLAGAYGLEVWQLLSPDMPRKTVVRTKRLRC